MVKGKLLVGPILGIIGGGLLLIVGFLSFGVQAGVEPTLALLTLTWGDVGFDPILFTISSILTLVFAALAIIGAILGFVGKRVPGGALMLIGGIGAVVGYFVPVGVIDLPLPYPDVPISLVYPGLFWVPGFLILISGILGLALKAKS
ncbi:MAG: hypothetical protein ACFFB0_19660 [Promethearchaeota archaeon]